jgi:hypothetical protein
MNNEQKRVLTYGVKLGTLKRKRWNWRRFLWQFLLTAIVCIGIPFAVLWLIVHDNTEGFPQYNSQLRATPHGE